MTKEKDKSIGKKERKRIYAFNLSENVVNKLNDKIGYASRSKALEKIISKWLAKAK